MVRYLGDVGDLVVAAHPEVVVGHGRVQAWVFGPGVSPDDAGQRRRIGYAFEHVLQRGEPAVVDAGALELLPSHVRAARRAHAARGELARVLHQRGEDVRARRRRGRAAALGAPCARGDGCDRAAQGPGDRRRRCAAAPRTRRPTRPRGWRPPGAGDVLAGLLGALLAGRVDAIARGPDDRGRARGLRRHWCTGGPRTAPTPAGPVGCARRRRRAAGHDRGAAPRVTLPADLLDRSRRCCRADLAGSSASRVHPVRASRRWPRRWSTPSARRASSCRWTGSTSRRPSSSASAAPTARVHRTRSTPTASSRC